MRFRAKGEHQRVIETMNTETDVTLDGVEAPGSKSETPLLGSAEFDDADGELEVSKQKLGGAEYDTDEEEVVETARDIVNSTQPEGSVAGQRKYAHEEPQMLSWQSHKKHVFILSSAGKPIYSRYGDESQLAGFMGVLSAIISFIDDDDDTMRGIVAGEHKVAFVMKGPIYLICVAKTGEPFSQLTQQLNYYYSQILCTLTSGVNKIFQSRAQFDIRNLLGGTEKFIDDLATWMDHDPALIVNSIHCLRLNPSVRSVIGSIMYSAKIPDLLFSVLIAKHQLVNLVRPRKHVLHPSDLHLVFNFVNACTAFRTSETWTPICLPRFNDSGFLHAYLKFIAPDLCLVLISTKADHFYPLSEVKNTIVQRFEQTGIFQELSVAMKHQHYSVSDVKIPGLMHFLYKSLATNQITCPRLEAPYSDRHEQKRLFRVYQNLHRRVHIKGGRPHLNYYHVSDAESILAWVSSGFVLYATFGPLEPLKTVITSCNRLIRWIKQEENTIFVLDSPMFNT